MNTNIDSVSAHVKAAWVAGLALALVLPSAIVLYYATPTTEQRLLSVLGVVAAISALFWRWCFAKAEKAVTVSEELLRQALLARATGAPCDLVASTYHYAPAAEDAWQVASVWQLWGSVAAALTGGCIAVGAGYVLVHL